MPIVPKPKAQGNMSEQHTTRGARSRTYLVS